MAILIFEFGFLVTFSLRKSFPFYAEDMALFRDPTFHKLFDFIVVLLLASGFFLTR